MSQKDIYEKFNIAIRYRLISLIILLFIPICLVVIPQKVFKYPIGILVFVIAVFLDQQYKCPVCKEKFDTRVSPSKLIYCPYCRARLRE